MTTSFGCLLLVLCVSELAVAQSTTVEMAFSTVFPVVEGFTEAICTFSTSTAGQIVVSVSWWHNVTQPVSGEGGRVSVSTDLEGGESVLSIDSVLESDAGEYTCRVDFTNPSQQKTDTAGLQVASELVVEAEAEQTAIEGDTAVLACNVTSFPAPRMRWFRVESGGEEVLLASHDDPDEEGFGVYVIEEAAESDSGIYRCEGQYSFGRESADIELVVLTVPVITTSAVDLIVLYTDSIHLNCSATGVKEPSYRWLFEGEELVAGDGVELDPENGDLRIGALTYDNTGSYTCVAETGAGSDNLTHSVSVEGPPEISLPRERQEVIVAGNSVVEIKCPFRSLPLPKVTWIIKIGSDGRREEINSLAGGFTIFDNGSLLIANVSQSQASDYDCLLSNIHGSDNRSFILMVIELPRPPIGFSVIARGDRSVDLVWSAPLSSPIRPVDHYLLELTYEERRGNFTSTEVIPNNRTSHVADDLVPGVTYSLVLRSSNIAGVSTPTPPLSHSTTAAAPRLEFFSAESLGDGYSILLQWRLLYSGGEDVDTFFIEVMVEGVVVETLTPNVYDESLLLDDLRPSTEYHFQSVVGSALGRAEPLEANATTPIAAPSKPTRPALDERSLQTLTISFSLKFGSYPIDYYLLSIINADDIKADTTNASNVTVTQADAGDLVNITSGDVDYVRSEVEVVEGGEVVGYDVRLRIGGLRQGEEYVFSVAAANSVGLGEYSDLSDPFSLEDEILLYLIVGGVAGGVVLFVVLLVVGLIVCGCMRKKCRGGKMTITRRGSDSTGVAIDFNLKFESFNGSYPGTTSPIPSQGGVDSMTPPPGRVVSPRLTSPSTHNHHYYNSLRKYQLDTLPAGGGGRKEGVDGERVVEIQVHSNHKSNGGTRQPPPFQPPPSLTTSSTLPSSLPPSSSTSIQHPSYTHPTSHPLYNTPRSSNHTTQVSMSSLPTSDEVQHVVVSSGSSTLPRGTSAAHEEYTFMSAQGTVGGRHGSVTAAERRFNSEEKAPMGEISMHASYQTDV